MSTTCPTCPICSISPGPVPGLINRKKDIKGIVENIW
jgi:hypothetical protein